MNDIKNKDKEQQIVNQIILKFTKLFQAKGYILTDNFDYNVWFINNNTTTSSYNNFKLFLESSPSESDDIIKFLFY